VSVTLRPVRDIDAAWLDGWLAPVAAAVGYDVLDADRPGASLLARLETERALRARIIVRAEGDAGLIVWREYEPERGAATIELVATPPEQSRRGAGMAAATAVEAELREAGVRAVYAPAPAVHGIDVYFWIRLGYRPLRRGDWPCERTGVAWLRRDI
jgi:GNAT superfamily N-acetyltransferase